jgi:multisubunit Na+/H+ antiporter MnhC subunit
MSATTAQQPTNVVVGFGVVAVVLVVLARCHLNYWREDLD